MSTHKQCGRCRKRRPRYLFRRDNGQLDGRHPACVDCEVGYKYGLELRPLYDAHGGLCGICDQAVSWRATVWDHVVPRSFDGQDSLDNLQPSHQSCNQLKKDFPLELARKRVRDRRHVATDVTIEHIHAGCDRCKREFTCHVRRCGYRRTCDECFDQAVARGRWQRGMSVRSILDERPSRRGAGRTPAPPPTDVVLTKEPSGQRICTVLQRGEALEILNREQPDGSPWIITWGPRTCPTRPTERLHYGVAPMRAAAEAAR